MIKYIIKRNGTKERFDIMKPGDWLKYSSENLDPDLADISNILIEAYQLGKEEMSSQDFQKLLITVALSKETYTTNMIAGKLYACYIHKSLYPTGFPTVAEYVKKLQDLQVLDTLPYSEEEYEEINKHINHELDKTMPYYSLKHILVKYALGDSKEGVTYETPQFACMRMALALASEEPKDIRVQEVINFYKEFSSGRLNAPTPNWRNLGTYSKGLASCCLYSVEDTARSISVGHTITEVMTYMSAGIGGKSMIRSLGNPVRNGVFNHQGKQPYQIATRALTKANLQGSRGGASTEYIDVFDPEIRAMIMYQNPRTPEDKKIRGMHFAVILNPFFMKKALKGEEIFLFNCYTAPDLYEAFSKGDESEFIKLYEKYEKDDSFVKIWDNAREIAILIATQYWEVSTVYSFNITEANTHTPFKDPIYSSNLCVAPETTILTDEGHVPIVTKAGKKVNIWNGEEWSEVEVVKTGEHQKLITVKLSNGRELDCTEYHKWYIQDTHTDKVHELRTKGLEIGQKLIKVNLPVIEGWKHLPFPYHNGFYTGAGTPLSKDQARIYLYTEKMKLNHLFGDNVKWKSNLSANRIEADFSDLKYKYFVPDSEYTIKSRLEWLAGFLDSSDHVYRKEENEAYNATSMNKQFLLEVQDMLQTLGIESEVNKLRDSEAFKLSLRDKTGERYGFKCNGIYRLLISDVESQKLLSLGLKTNYFKMSKSTPQSNATKSVTVIEIVDNGRYDTTYCVAEPKRHMAVFNGILTGQCTEITVPTKPYKDMLSLFTPGHHEGEVGLCSLAGIVYTRIDPEDDEQYLKTAYYALKMIDYCIHNSSYEIPSIGYTAKNRLNSAVGLLDVAHHMARNYIPYDCSAGYKELHKIAERHSYFVIKASLQLGKEKGNAPWIDKTKWPDGWLPIDTYNRNVDTISDFNYRYDWEELRKEIIANKGIRNSSLVAHMPTEASSKAAAAMNGIYPARMLSMVKTDGTNAVEWCAPSGDTHEQGYELAWNIPVVNMIKIYSIFQKFCDQSISADIYRDRRASTEIKHSELLDEMAAMVHYGLKSRYYSNSLTVNATNEDDEIATAFGEEVTSVVSLGNDGGACAGGACTI